MHALQDIEMTTHSANIQTITRFAPSPTGLLHVGNIRTALINWLYARKHAGKFIFRVDDTDAARSKKEYEVQAKNDLQWLGIEWDETFNQIDRSAAYEIAKNKLIESGRLYPCYETEEELELSKKILRKKGLPPIYDRAALKLSDADKASLDKRGIKKCWRFLLKEETISWNDMIKGPISFDSSKLSDPILFKSDGSMTYALASVVDDIFCNVSHIIRGEDHITNTAIHIQMFEALEAARTPIFGHLSLMYNTEGEISKRVGGFDIQSLRSDGIEAMTIVSMLSKIGTSQNIKCATEMSEIIRDFDISSFSKSNVQYNHSDMMDLNQKMLQMLEYDAVKSRLGDIPGDFWYAVRKNVSSVDNVADWWRICNEPLPHYENCVQSEHASKIKSYALDIIQSSQEEVNFQDLVQQIMSKVLCAKKDVMLTMRLAITGLKRGPEIGKILPFIDRNVLIERLSSN